MKVINRILSSFLTCLYFETFWLSELSLFDNNHILIISIQYRSARIKQNDLSRDERKPVFRVSDQVRHKSACKVTEAG